jgi:hypothetical protein
MCTDAYREALTRALSSTVSSPEVGPEGVASAVAESAPAIALATDASRTLCRTPPERNGTRLSRRRNALDPGFMAFQPPGAWGSWF